MRAKKATPVAISHEGVIIEQSGGARPRLPRMGAKKLPPGTKAKKATPVEN